MRIHVLGSAAGGGFPQWNCNCRLCDGVRHGRIRARQRTQSSIAVTGNGQDWLLCNASPDLRQQLLAFPELQPARAARDCALRAIVLMDAQIDHVTGLVMLREHGSRWPLWCTRPVHGDLTQGNPVLSLLDHYCGVDWHEITLAAGFTIPEVPGIRMQATGLTSNAPPYSPRRDQPVAGDNIGLTFTDTGNGRSLFYAPGLGTMEPATWQAMQAADCVLVDGTCWSDDEMIALGLSKKRAQDMGHMAQSGADGMLAWLARLPATTRRILIHINNTNPILDEDSAEHAAVRAAGVEIACDGLEIDL